MAFAILRFIWRHKASFAILLIFSVVVLYIGIKFYGVRRDNADYIRQLQSYEVVTKIHEGAYLQQTAQLELAETLIREYSPQPTTEVAYQAGVKVIYKTRTVHVPVIETRIEYRDKYIEIAGTQTKPDAIDLSYTLAPLKFDLFVTRVKGRYATIVDTHDPDLTVEMTTKLDPAVFQDDRHWFAGAGPVIRLRDFKVDDFDAADIGAQVQVGYMFPRWYLSLTAQYLDGFGAGLIAGGRF